MKPNTTLLKLPLLVPFVDMWIHCDIFNLNPYITTESIHVSVQGCGQPMLAYQVKFSSDLIVCSKAESIRFYKK